MHPSYAFIAFAYTALFRQQKIAQPAACFEAFLVLPQFLIYIKTPSQRLCMHKPTYTQTVNIIKGNGETLQDAPRA